MNARVLNKIIKYRNNLNQLEGQPNNWKNPT